ncbi:MAG: hypothetical protein AB8F94_08885 [Saprospiraceae bacterium]
MISKSLFSFFKKNKTIINKGDKPTEAELDDRIIQQIKLQVQERRELFQQMKSLYQPENDLKESEIYYFLNGINSEKDLKKLSIEYLADYQKRNNIKLPHFIIRILSEIGSGRYINHHFVGNNNELQGLVMCLEEEFLNKCVSAGVPPKFIEEKLYWSYDFEKNSFNHPQVQSIYESLNSKRDKNITILFALGGHSSYITLNRVNNTQVAVFDICGICNKTFTVDGIEYESPYFMYQKIELKSSILGNINTHYWYRMLEKIKTMNAKPKGEI